MSKRLLLILLCALFPLFSLTHAFAQDSTITGLWKTIDDETGKKKSIVKIYEQDGKYFGRIVKLFRKSDEDQNPVCDECADDDARKDKPIKGMVILEDLEKKGSVYKNGKILDPNNGKIYNCKIWREGDNLILRGYIFFLFRTQTWLPAQSADE